MALNIEFKNQDQVVTGTILKNKGICWQVELADGSTCLVQKKHMVRTWEAEALPTAAGDPLGILALLLAAGDNAAQLEAEHKEEPAPKEKKVRVKKDPEAEPVVRDPNLVSLKELCFDCQVEPRIARRQLRKAQGLVGIGGRWEWMKDSEELVKVRALLLGAAAAE